MHAPWLRDINSLTANSAQQLAIDDALAQFYQPGPAGAAPGGQR